ncbi:hypothetical protein Tco_0989826 [Tanacetum coccineum]|uniref:Uncharacterized protein n=1 Tax=Tanacetum coccineum TaxID=301880 RepID=A0ABQ5EW63_9ASTR
MSMNYQPVFAGNQTNGNTGTKANINAGQAGKKTVSSPQYVLLPFLTSDSKGPKSSDDEFVNDTRKKNEVHDLAKEGDKNEQEKDVRDQEEALRNNLINKLKDCSSFTTVYLGRERDQRNEFESVFGQEKDANGDSTYRIFTLVNVVGSSYENHGGSIPVNVATFPNDDLLTDPLMPDLEDTTSIFSGAYNDEDVGAKAVLNNLETTMSVSPIPTTRIHTEHPKVKIIGDINSATQTRRMIKMYEEHDMVMQRADGIFISQDKYVADILKKFDFSLVKTASTLIETNKALLKDKGAEDVDVHLYRSIIRSLMYLTASRPDIMFAVCACARDSPFDLEAFSDSDYAGASLDRKSTIGGSQFLSKRLISWQCIRHTIDANSTTEAEYVAAANCCRQVLWIQNQMLDYGFNFMNTKIYIDNESTIYIVKNPVFHSKTKHIDIRHHFIRDSYEKKLIQVIKIHTDQNVADLLTKAFDVCSDEFGVKTGSYLKFVDQHNMVACLERTEENAEFHQIVDFLTTSSIHHALWRVTPLFASMLAPPVVGDEGSRQPSEPQPPSLTTQPIIEEQIIVTES